MNLFNKGKNKIHFFTLNSSIKFMYFKTNIKFIKKPKEKEK